MLKANFVCPLPPTLNEQINIARTHWSKSAKCKEEWTNKILLLAKLQNIPAFPSKVWLAFVWELKSFARDPVDNIPASAKYIMDGLVNAGVLTKDSLMVIQSPIVHQYIKAKVDKVTITISDCPIFEIKSHENSNR